MEKWMEVTLSIPPGYLNSPRKFREILAFTNGQADPQDQIDSRIFHYTFNENGKKVPIASIPMIRFGARAGKPQIYAIGDESIEILNTEVSKIVRLMEQHYRVSIDEQRITKPFRTGHKGTLASYWTPIMVFQGEPRQHKRFVDELQKNIASEALFTFITEKITRSIERQCLALGFDPHEEGYVIGDVKINGDILPIKVKDDIYALSAKDLSFRTSLDLTGGPWHIGHLSAKGYGRIYPGIPRGGE